LVRPGRVAFGSRAVDRALAPGVRGRGRLNRANSQHVSCRIFEVGVGLSSPIHHHIPHPPSSAPASSAPASTDIDRTLYICAPSPPFYPFFPPFAPPKLSNPCFSLSEQPRLFFVFPLLVEKRETPREGRLNRGRGRAPPLSAGRSAWHRPRDRPERREDPRSCAPFAPGVLCQRRATFAPLPPPPLPGETERSRESSKASTSPQPT
jgi:hypothetical protein